MEQFVDQKLLSSLRRKVLKVNLFSDDYGGGMFDIG